MNYIGSYLHVVVSLVFFVSIYMIKLEEVQKSPESYTYAKHCVYSCQYHVIFCPKYRRDVFKDELAKARLEELIREKQDEYGYSVIKLVIMPDHVHLILSANPKIGIYTIVNMIKGYTGRTIMSEFPKIKSRIPTLWTRSKFISTVGSVSLDIILEYIENQRNV